LGERGQRACGGLKRRRTARTGVKVSLYGGAVDLFERSVQKVVRVRPRHLAAAGRTTGTGGLDLPGFDGESLVVVE
jgi:hypothetical protein